MSKQVAVIGLGRFGTSLALTLHNAGCEVLAIDKVSSLVESIAPDVTHAVQINATNESALRKLGISGFDAVVVTVGSSIQDSVMITILLKKLGVRYIVARADNELHGAILESIGADKVIFPERDTAHRTGPVLTMRDVTDFIPLGEGSGVVKAKATPYFIGKTLADIGFGSGAKKGVVVLMIQRGKEGIINPDLQEVVSHIDILIMGGNNSEMEKLFEKVQKAEKAEKAEKAGEDGAKKQA
ncbi:MAG: TrkA family potassium uptake protein [Dehalococcoidales bacterium]|nr:TrkA family potassium uptake protein [Dehalococcoidales bacterium]